MHAPGNPAKEALSILEKQYDWSATLTDQETGYLRTVTHLHRR